MSVKCGCSSRFHLTANAAQLLEPLVPASSRRSTTTKLFAAAAERFIRLRKGMLQCSLTTAQGGPVADDQNALEVEQPGPTLIEDFHFREKILHCGHERIPDGRARALSSPAASTVSGAASWRSNCNQKATTGVSHADHSHRSCTGNRADRRADPARAHLRLRR